jgi:hypothetical protein
MLNNKHQKRMLDALEAASLIPALIYFSYICGNTSFLIAQWKCINNKKHLIC